MADFQLGTLRSKVSLPSPDSLPPNSQCMNTASCTPVTVTPPSILRHRDLNLHLPRPGHSALALPLNHNNRYILNDKSGYVGRWGGDMCRWVCREVGGGDVWRWVCREVGW